MSEDRPLVTFALFAYNQERWIQKAIDGAFRQDYRPLEIILSDDCSSDGTFEVMQRAAAIAPPDVTVKIARGTANRGIAAHLNSIMALASGELIVIAAGDDISRPRRTSRLVAKWVEEGKQPGLLHSACSVISESGTDIGERSCDSLEAMNSLETLARSNERIIGATGAWVPALFQVFGALRSDLVNEDRVLPFRSLLLGKKITYIDEPLVHYRQGVGISTMYWQNRNISRANRIRVLNILRIDILQKLTDLAFNPDEPVSKILNEKLAWYDAAIAFESGFPTLSALLKMVKSVGFYHVARMMLKHVFNRFMNYRHGD